MTRARELFDGLLRRRSRVVATNGVGSILIDG